MGFIEVIIAAGLAAASLALFFAVIGSKYANKKKIFLGILIAMFALNAVKSHLMIREMDAISAAQYGFSVVLVPIDAESGEPFGVGVIQAEGVGKSWWGSSSRDFDADELRARLTWIGHDHGSEGRVHQFSGRAVAPVVIRLKGEGYQEELVVISEDTKEGEIRVPMTRNDVEDWQCEHCEGNRDGDADVKIAGDLSDCAPGSGCALWFVTDGGEEFTTSCPKCSEEN